MDSIGLFFGRSCSLPFFSMQGDHASFPYLPERHLPAIAISSTTDDPWSVRRMYV